MSTSRNELESEQQKPFGDDTFMGCLIMIIFCLVSLYLIFAGIYQTAKWIT